MNNFCFKSTKINLYYFLTLIFLWQILYNIWNLRKREEFLSFWNTTMFSGTICSLSFLPRGNFRSWLSRARIKLDQRETQHWEFHSLPLLTFGSGRFSGAILFAGSRLILAPTNNQINIWLNLPCLNCAKEIRTMWIPNAKVYIVKPLKFYEICTIRFFSEKWEFYIEFSHIFLLYLHSSISFILTSFHTWSFLLLINCLV